MALCHGSGKRMRKEYKIQKRHLVLTNDKWKTLKKTSFTSFEDVKNQYKELNFIWRNKCWIYRIVKKRFIREGKCFGCDLCLSGF